MKTQNLMFLALLAPLAQPALAKTTVTYSPDAVMQKSGGLTHSVVLVDEKPADDKGRKKGGQRSIDEPGKLERSGQRKAEDKTHKGGRKEGQRKAEEPKAQKTKAMR